MKIHYVLVEVSGDYNLFISAAEISHKTCFPDNELSIRFNNLANQAVVKIACMSGKGSWSTYNCVMAIYQETEVSSVRNLINGPDWTIDEDV